MPKRRKSIDENKPLRFERDAFRQPAHEEEEIVRLGYTDEDGLNEPFEHEGETPENGKGLGRKVA